MKEIIQISDLGKIITGKTPPTGNKNYWGNHMLFIKPTDINEECKYTYTTEQGFTEIAAEKYASSRIPKGAICVTCIGTIGRKMTKAHCDCFVNQSINAIITNEKFDEEYVYYLIKNFLPNLKQYNLGTASGREFVSKSNFEKIQILAETDLSTQLRIASILSRYDDLIENYQHQIQLLEEAAQRLYKEWFVDLHFPGYENTNIVDGVPEGWEKKTFKNCLQEHLNGGWGKEFSTGSYTNSAWVVRGTDIEKLKSGQFKETPLRFHTNRDIQNKTIRPYDFIIELSNGNINNVGRSFIFDELILKQYKGQVMCASFCKLLRPLSKSLGLVMYNEVVYMQESKIMMKYKKNGANGINNFDFNGFLEHSFLFPNEKKLINLFDKYIKLISTYRVQINLLTEARDRLLPKLMSGEITV